MKIAAVVFNSVLHDARVKKEADSLAEAGHEVVVFGLADSRVSGGRHSTTHGVPIYLTDWRHCHKSRLYVMILLSFLVSLVPLTYFVYWLVNNYSDVLVSHYHEFLTFLIVGVVVLIFLYRWYAGWKKIEKGGVYADDEQAASPFKKMMYSLRRGVFSLCKKGGSILTLYRFSIFRSAIMTEIERFGPDAVHCHDVPTLPIGLAMKKKYGTKIVFDSHEIYEEMANIPLVRKYMAIYYQKKAASRLDRMVTVNHHIAAFLHEKYAYPEPVVVCNACVLPSTAPSNDGRLHEAARVDPSTKILLFQGGLAKHRGLVPLIKSARLLPEGWCIVFMGRGYYEWHLKSLAAAVDPTMERIRFIPQVPQQELLEWTACASLGIIPYENVCLNHWYCSPNKIWEYSAAGLPLLVSPFPFIQETVETNGIGWVLSDPVTPEVIAQRIASLSDDDLAAARQACRRFAEADNWNKYEQRLVRLYEDLSRNGQSATSLC